jgi:hypothetical protein
MRGMSAQPELPLRPMTLGELLDAAMVLLRRRALPLLGSAAVLAAAEQLALAPVRAAAALTPPFYGPPNGGVQDWWAVTALGFGLEATIITLLATMAGAEAGAALVRRKAKVRLFRDGRWWAAAGAAVLLGVICALAAYAGFLPWIFAWGLFGLAGPVLTIDRSGNSFTAIGRSAALAARNGLRGCWVMAAGYLTWFAVRFALGAGWTQVVSTVFGARPQWESWLAPLAWALADTVAYAALACVAAVLVLDIRMRTEGLDIAIRRAGPAELVHVR